MREVQLIPPQKNVFSMSEYVRKMCLIIVENDGKMCYPIIDHSKGR